MPQKFGTVMSVHFILDNYDSNDRRTIHRIQRRCVYYNIKTCRKPLKKWVILIVLQFRYTFYKPTNLYTATDDDGNDVVK